MSISQNSTNIIFDTKKHSFAHLMAAAVGKMFPEAQYGVGPVIENGCYYDFILPRPLIPEDLDLLDGHIREMLKSHLSFKHQEYTLEDAIIHFEKANQPLKVELLENLRDRGTTSMSEEERADFELNTNHLDIISKINEDLEYAHYDNKNIKIDENANWLIVRLNDNFAINTDTVSTDQIPSLIINSDNRTFDFGGVIFEIDKLEFLGGFVNSWAQGDINDYKKCFLLDLNKFDKDFKFTHNIEFLDKDRFLNKAFELAETNHNYRNLDFVKILEKNIHNIPTITLYRIIDEKTGEIIFEDLCKGPHVKHIKEIKNIGFKLDKFSSAYWRGDQERGINMQRLYALVFETKDELKTFVEQRDEAKKRDHRVLGQSLKLFTISELVGSGLPLLQPKGAIIRKILEDYLWQLQKKTHQRVYTPHITKEALYEKSGHAGKYLEDMFSVYGGTSKETFFLKPMNCPMHMQIFADNQFSYRDMPVRYFDPTTVYRDEKTGQLSGLTRVRSITQDDGHIFCKVDQIESEFTAIVKTITEFYGSLGMTPDWVSWSVRDSQNPEKYLGNPENWEIAEESIRKAAEINGLRYKKCEGEAAFYGPKLDFMFKDCINREWQLSTIQCDFVQPERFELGFTNENGEKERPVVIHRAICGSLERFMGILIEHFAGKFPFWLSPEQIRILTINDQVLDYVEEIKAVLDDTVLMKPLKYNEIRYTLDERSESLGKKIRDATLDKIPMMIIVGQKDVDAQEVSIRTQEGEVKVKLNELKTYLEGIRE